MKFLLLATLSAFSFSALANCNLKIENLEPAIDDNVAFFKIEQAAQKKGYTLLYQFDELKENDLVIQDVFKAGNGGYKVIGEKVVEVKKTTFDMWYGFNSYMDSVGCEANKEYILKKFAGGQLRNSKLISASAKTDNDKGCNGNQMAIEIGESLVKNLPRCSSK